MNAGGAKQKRPVADLAETRLQQHTSHLFGGLDAGRRLRQIVLCPFIPGEPEPDIADEPAQVAVEHSPDKP